MKKNFIALLIGMMLSISTMEILLGETLWLKDKHVSSIYYIVKHRIYPILFRPERRIINSISTYYLPHTPFVADKYLGYSHKPGEYEVTLSPYWKRAFL